MLTLLLLLHASVGKTKRKIAFFSLIHRTHFQIQQQVTRYLSFASKKIIAYLNISYYFHKQSKFSFANSRLLAFVRDLANIILCFEIIRAPDTQKLNFKLQYFRAEMDC